MSAWSLLIGLAQSLSHSIDTSPFLQVLSSATLYNPSESQNYHFSLEDVDSMFLQKTGFYQQCQNPEDHHKGDTILIYFESYPVLWSLIEKST
jgi:hypothetical protein